MPYGADVEALPPRGPLPPSIMGILGKTHQQLDPYRIKVSYQTPGFTWFSIYHRIKSSASGRVSSVITGIGNTAPSLPIVAFFFFHHKEKTRAVT